MGRRNTSPQGNQALSLVVEQHIVVVPSLGALDNNLVTTNADIRILKTNYNKILHKKQKETHNFSLIQGKEPRKEKEP